MNNFLKLSLLLCVLAVMAVAPAHSQPNTRRKPRVLAPGANLPGARPANDDEAEGKQDEQDEPGGPAAPPSQQQNEEDLPPQFETGIDYEPTPPRAPVTFNLENADLPDLVRLISNITGRRFILPSKTRTIQASVYAPTKVTAAEAYRAFLSILELNGMTVVPSGRYLKIVETAGIENRPVPVYPEGTVTPNQDRYITRLHRLENVGAEDAAQLLGQFKTQEGNVTAYAPTNTIIITDIGSNIRRMMRILEGVDVPQSGEQVWVEPLHYVNATEMAELLQEIYSAEAGDGGGGGGGTPARRRRARRQRGQEGGGTETIGSDGGAARLTSIIPDERTNSLIILATEGAYLRILELIRKLDVPMEGEGRIHVHYIQHTDAEEVASTLSELTGGQGGSRPARGGEQGGGASATAGAGQLFEGSIAITSHKPTNSLVITSSLHDYAALRGVINKLDAPRRQVFIEAAIMELSVDRSTRLGLSYHGGLEDTPADDTLTVLGFNAANSLNILGNQDVLTGLALGVRGPTIANSQQLVGLSIPAVGVVINALATAGDVNVLSTPHIIALDNEEAEITVGANVPLQTSGIAGGIGPIAGLLGGQQNQAGAGGAAGLAALAGLGGGGLGGGVQRQDVGTTIRITPHINEANSIRMEIEEEISEVQPPQGTLGVVPFSKRLARTQLVVDDQQTVVIGGLMRDRVTTSEDKIPILGDLPLLGMLFRRSTKSTQKTNLLLFLTPYIVRDQTDLRAIFERKMRERQEFIDRYFVFGDEDYEPPIDYSRTRGLVAEIINEVKAMRSEEALLEEIRQQPPPEHVPQPPIGVAPARPRSFDEGGDGGGSAEEAAPENAREGNVTSPEAQRTERDREMQMFLRQRRSRDRQAPPPEDE